MKSFHPFLLFLLFFTSLHASAPRFYITGQIGAFTADAGTLAALGSPLPSSADIKSGTKTFSDVSLGAELLEWLSLEGGYVDFSSFVSPSYTRGLPVAPQALWEAYDLRGFRLTPVFRVFSGDRLACSFLGGITFATGKVIERDKFSTGKGERQLANSSYHIGVAIACRLTKQATLETRVLRYDFGKPEHDPNRITAMTYSLGLSWHF